MIEPKLPENPLAISWHDTQWLSFLNQHTVMEYFSERSNPFYDRTCNNEILKMQRGSPEQLVHMQGIEFCLLHVQEPILFVIRKQHRTSPTQTTPIADYYIINGTVYQAPDLGSVLNSRLLTTVNHLQSAFEEARQYARYHPSRGYWWEFDKKKPGSVLAAEERAKEERLKKLKESKNKRKKKLSRRLEQEKRAKDEPSSLFQRRRVDVLLDLLVRKFSPKAPGNQAPLATAAGSAADKDAVDVKSEKDVALSSIKSEKTEQGGAKREPSSASRGPDSKKMKLS